jgi:hypothetical protein
MPIEVAEASTSSSVTVKLRGSSIDLLHCLVREGLPDLRDALEDLGRRRTPSNPLWVPGVGLPAGRFPRLYGVP